MTTQTRRERERADRHQLIVKVARELAEAEGWDAVTTRRLAQRIEYSQPVLYSHFAGKDAIVGAVAVEGFAELAAALHRARTTSSGRAGMLAAVSGVYLEFARRSPALYDAMFNMPTDLEFGGPDSPAPLKAAFGELFAVFAELAGGRDVDALTEVGWSALHGLVMLDRGGRLREDLRQQRLAVLVDQFLAVPN